MSWTIAGVFTLLALTAWSAAAAPHAHRVERGRAHDELDGVVRELRRGTMQQSDGRHLVVLRALRDLRDPALRPLFTHLTGHQNELIRINGILGLAELSPERRVDPRLIARIESDRGRYLAIRHALDLDLLGVEQMEQMLAWNDLQDASRLLLLAELSRRGVAPNRAMLAPLAAKEDLSIAGLASSLLAQAGEPGGFEAFRSKLEALSDSRRLQVQIWHCEDIARYRLTHLLQWIDELLSRPDVDPALAFAGAAATMELDIERGLVLLPRALGAEPGLAQRVRYGRLLLEFADRHEIPAAAYERIRSDEALPARIADLGAALAANRPSLAAMRELIALDHWASSSRTLELARVKLDVEDQARLYEFIIKRVDQPGPRRDERAELAIRATSELFRIKPEAVAALLREAPDDGPKQETILIGLLALDLPAAGELGRIADRRGFSRADSLALLLTARHAARLEAADLDALRLIAEGGGRLSPAHQAQAAWFYARFLNRAEQAVSRVLADS